MPTVEKLNEYTVILDNGHSCIIDGPGFVASNGQLVFPVNFTKHSERVSEPGIPLAVFPLSKVACLVATQDRDSSCEFGWGEIGGSCAVRVGELTVTTGSAQQSQKEAHVNDLADDLDQYRDSCIEWARVSASGAPDTGVSLASGAMLKKYVEILKKHGNPPPPAPEIVWPEHAKYRATNPDGSTLFFGGKPYITQNGWDSDDEVQRVDLSACQNWKDTLITRPT